MTGVAGRGVGLGLIYELASSPTACTSAAAAVSAAILYRPVATCSESASATVQDDEWPYDAPKHQSGSAAGAGLAAPGYRADGTPRFELKTVQSVYHPGNLAFTAFRSAFFNLLPISNEYFRQVEAAEEAAFAQGREPLEEWPPFPTEQLRPALHRSVWASLRELATLTVRRVYERLVAQYCSLATTTKLLKDARESSKRKVKYLQWYKPLYRVPKTYFCANILGAAADCTVSIAVDTYRVIYLPAHKGVQRDRRMVLRRLLRICAADVFRCTTGLAAASLGAGLGALLFQPLHRPATGTFIGASAAEFGFTFFVVAPLVNDWAYGPDDHPPRIPAEAEQLEGERPPGLDRPPADAEQLEGERGPPPRRRNSNNADENLPDGD